MATLLWAVGAHAQAQRPLPTLDSALTRQVYALGPDFDQARWAGLSPTLRFRAQPVWAGVGSGYVSLRDRLLRCPTNLDSGSKHPLAGNYWLHYGGPSRWQATAALRQLNNQMDNLDLDRRAVEYERLSMVLREKASRMRKLEEALPALVFALDEAGKVVGVTVDPTRTKSGLTSRSRGLMLKALRDERFRLPARQYTVATKATHYRPVVRHALEEPRAFNEKLHRLSLGYRAKRLGQGLVWASTPLRLPVRALLYRKTARYGRCHTFMGYVWVPRFWPQRY
ncbi:hypothetical protein MON38_06500 [Hymenobacter sp. DH14]|uniref:Uncharacterized protein n=1 Tax=Hymenobacter cyanobacteriorum TaxID=2926463 RepID=A0A9X1VED5_9BACT|nr:hypothetical protein [Hymenobacter cyanobacteriorum]MCI1187063.1 hypothetical protein [Hymenobacter cyanobacteriorum]